MRNKIKSSEHLGRKSSNITGKVEVGTSNGAGVPVHRLRQNLILKMAVTMLVAASIMAPLAVLSFSQGEYIPAIVLMLVIGVSSHSYFSIRKGKTILLIELLAVLSGGLLLTFADPNLLDPGLAIVLLVPIHLVLVRGKTKGNNILVTFPLLATYAGICIVGWLPDLLKSGAVIGWTGLVYFVAIVAIQIFTAQQIYKFRQKRDQAHSLAVRHLVEHMGDGYVRISPEGRTLFASTQTEKLLGSPRYELTGSGLLDRVHILDRPILLKGLSDSAHSGARKSVELRMRKDNPNESSTMPVYVWIEVFFSPAAEPDIAVEKWELVALLRDITTRKDREFELISARKLAEEASVTKSGFLATIGHELRTPLNAIVGFSEMMSNGIGGELVPAHEEYADLIHRSGHHLLEIVNMLLDMSKIDAGKFELSINSFEADELVLPCIKMVEANAHKKSVKITAELNKNLPTIQGDERACRQILINLLSNAVKFSEADSEVIVSVKRQGQHLNISVKDSGIGMSQEAKKRVGEAFFQVQNGLSRQYEGTGLGLSIVKGLVALHDGKMKVNSALGQGTNVTVMLPINGPKQHMEPVTIVTPITTNSQKTKLGPCAEQRSIAS